MVCRDDLKRPAGQHERRWAKYAEIIQLEDGSLYIPNNKRAKKLPPVIAGEIPTPILLGQAVHDAMVDIYGEKMKTYSAWLYAKNGFIIHAHRGKKGASATAVAATSPTNARPAITSTAANNAEELMVHVLHHPFVDDFAHSGLLHPQQDDSDPLLMLNPKGFKVKLPDGTSVRAFNVVVGSAYIEGVDNIAGRRIVAPERIAKVSH